MLIIVIQGIKSIIRLIGKLREKCRRNDDKVKKYSTETMAKLNDGPLPPLNLISSD